MGIQHQRAAKNSTRLKRVGVKSPVVPRRHCKIMGENGIEKVRMMDGCLANLRAFQQFFSHIWTTRG